MGGNIIELLTNPVLLSVAVMIILALINTNILIALILAALAGGVLSGLSVSATMALLVDGMGGNSETALAYVLLGALAAAIQNTGAADMLATKIGKSIKGKKYLLILLIAVIASFSQNLIPVHIAFIPILIPPLLKVMNDLKIDRRAVATALTYGLKAPYLTLPVGFGLLFHETITNAINETGRLTIEVTQVWKSMIFAGIAMTIGLLVAVFITYRKPREYENLKVDGEEKVNDKFKLEHVSALLGASTAFLIQIVTKSLPLGALGGLFVMFIMQGIFYIYEDGKGTNKDKSYTKGNVFVRAFNTEIEKLDEVNMEGINMMGFIAFVMLVAAGYGNVIKNMPVGVDALVEASVSMMGGSQFVASIVIVIMGLIITMGIGSSFATVPILASIFVPIAVEMNFSPPAIIALIGIASAVGDAGSPASDSTLGPTSGLNSDGQHDHIRDTVIPTFTHFSIPLMIAAVVAGMVL